jgi:hypothetical protein
VWPVSAAEASCCCSGCDDEGGGGETKGEMGCNPGSTFCRELMRFATCCCCSSDRVTVENADKQYSAIWLPIEGICVEDVPCVPEAGGFYRSMCPWNRNHAADVHINLPAHLVLPPPLGRRPPHEGRHAPSPGGLLSDVGGSQGLSLGAAL